MTDLKRFILGKFSGSPASKERRPLAEAFASELLDGFKVEKAVYNEKIADNPRGDPFMFDFVIEAWIEGDAELDHEYAKQLATKYRLDSDLSHTVLAREKIIKRGSAAVKGTFLSKRRPDSSVEEYLSYWRNEHAGIIMAQKDFFAFVRAYVQNHFVPGTYVTLGGKRLSQADSFDGSPQMWFDSAEDIHSAFATDGYHNHIKADEQILVKVGYSQSFIAREHPIPVPNGSRHA